MKLTKTLLPLLLIAVAANAHGSRPGPHVHEFGWAVIDGENTSASSTDDLPDVDQLKRRFGEEFLYMREDADRYVIRDRALMDRAREALKPMREAKGDLKGRGEQVRLSRKIDKLSGKIARAEARGESARELRREKKRLEALLGNMSDETNPVEHEARGRYSDEDLDRAIKNTKREMHDILREAKSRHLAERVE